MTDQKTKLTLADAAVVAGKSTNTLNRAKNSGKISVEKIEKIAYYDVSELSRVYPKTFDLSRLEKDNDNKKSQENVDSKNNPKNSVEFQLLEEKINSKEKEIEFLGKQLVREREILDREREINDDMKEALRKSQNHETYLLEYQEKKEGQGDDFKVVLKPMQDEIDNLTKLADENKKEKADLIKANRVYAWVAFLVLASLGIFAFVQSDIIQFN